MRKCANISPIYEEAVSHIWLCNRSILNFLLYEENFLFFFNSVVLSQRLSPFTSFSPSPLSISKASITSWLSLSFCPYFSLSKKFKWPSPCKQDLPFFILAFLLFLPPCCLSHLPQTSTLPFCPRSFFETHKTLLFLTPDFFIFSSWLFFSILQPYTRRYIFQNQIFTVCLPYPTFDLL